MKSFRQVEETRRAYHSDPTLNSVHRASLLVPEIEGSYAEISFLNHFLIKRGYQLVACRVTAVNPDGGRISSRLHPVDESRVYQIPLSGSVDGPVATWLVEFFSAENLFIPFPAVMVNHRGANWLNTVHAYNRILNDVFEDDEINTKQVAEASIDVRLDDDHDTFLMFTAGPERCTGTLDIELRAGAETMFAAPKLDVARLCHARVSLKSLFPGLGEVAGGVLKVHQPQQRMFYGRLFTGQTDGNGALSANHSFYDNSAIAEYWDNDAEAVRHYPLLPGLRSLVRFYPIMAPGTLEVTVELCGVEGAVLATQVAGEVSSPEGDMLEFDVNAMASEHGVADAASAFAVRVRPNAGKTPMRVAHQVVYRDAGDNDALEASINLGLASTNVFTPEYKKGLAWGQVATGQDIDGWLGFAWNHPHTEGGHVNIRFYNTTGLVAEESRDLPGRAALVFAPGELARILGRPSNAFAPVWYEARAERPDLSAFTVAQHRASRACSGEHNF